MNVKKFAEYWLVPKHSYYLGLLLCLVITSIEVFKDKTENFKVFYYSTIAFWGHDVQTMAMWGGTDPYTESFKHCFRMFLYTPVFSFLFTPLIWLPFSVSAFIWNITNYTLFYLAIMHLPKKIDVPKIKIFLYLLLLLALSLFPFQYNIVIAYIFVFSYILLEKNKPIWAVLLIMLSATTKIYGVFQLLMLFCYPKTWRNLGVAIAFGIGFLILPISHLGINGFLPYYHKWFSVLMLHNDTFFPCSLIGIEPFSFWTLKHATEMELGSMIILTIIFFSQYKQWRDFKFRTQALGVLMMWICLFSDATEFHTYIIAFVGYMMYYYSQDKHSRLDRWLYWLNWVLFCIFPIDIVCPPEVYNFEHHLLWLDIYVFTFTWLKLVYEIIMRDHFVRHLKS